MEILLDTVMTSTSDFPASADLAMIGPVDPDGEGM